MNNKEIANTLFITEGTVRFHVINILGEVGANDWTQAVTRGLQSGIIFLDWLVGQTEKS
jgi:DNA-binding NarL/FixJ family response regulator